MISTEALIAKFQQALNEDWGYIWGTAGIMWSAAKQQQKVNYMISNYGNTAADAAADAAANASITDILVPALTGVSVTYNGTAWTEGTEYTYSEESGIFTSDPGAITVPAATFETQPDGTVTAVPGTATLVLEGTVA